MRKNYYSFWGGDEGEENNRGDSERSQQGRPHHKLARCGWIPSGFTAQGRALPSSNGWRQRQNPR